MSMASGKQNNKLTMLRESNTSDELRFVEYRVTCEIAQSFLNELIDRVRSSEFKVNNALPKKSIYRKEIDLINSGDCFVDWVCFAFLFAKGDVDCDSKILKNFDKVVWELSVVNIYLSLSKGLLAYLNSFQEAYFFSLLEGDRLDSLWLSRAKIKVSNTSIEDFFTLSDYFCYFDRVNRHSLFLKGDLFAKNKKCLDLIGDMISNKLKEITKIIKKNKNNNKINKIALVVSRVFTSHNIKNNSHYLLAMGFLKLIDSINNQNSEEDKIDIGVFFTGEKTFTSPSKTMGVSEDADTQYVFDLMRDNCKSISYLSAESIENHSSRADMLHKSYSDIEQFGPDFLMFLGGTYDSKFIRYKCYTSYPVIFLPTTANVDNVYGRPDDYADLIRYINDEHHKKLLDFGIDNEKLFYNDKPVFRMEESIIDDLNWNDYFNIPIENPFLLLTPLFGTRISAWLSSLEYVDEEIISKTFKNNPKLCWILLGNNEEKLLNVFSKKKYLERLYQEKRLIIIEYTDKIESLIKSVDLLFVPTLGARTTIGMGADYLKPSIIPVGSDAQKIVAEEALFTDVNNAFSKIEKVFRDDSFYKYLANRTHELQHIGNDHSRIALDFFKNIKRLF